MGIYKELTKEAGRIVKDKTVSIEDEHKNYTLPEKLRHSFNVIEDVIEKGLSEYGKDLKIVVSCSFGVDSMIVLSLVNAICVSRGIPYDTVWNNTLNEFPETRQFAKQMVDRFDLNLIEATPTKTIKKIYKENGAETALQRKGNRKSGVKPVTEKCCDILKHQPMKRVLKQNGYHIMFNGVRAGESRQRWMSLRRDGEFFWSRKEWKTWVCRPIIFWTSMSDSHTWGTKQEDVWDYVRFTKLPYNPIYDRNAVIDSSYTGENVIVKREEAEKLSAEGIKVFMPRTGCMVCPIPIKRGYLRYLREVQPLVYRSMLFQMGFAEVLIREMEPEEREFLYKELNEFGIIDENTEESIIRKLEDIIEFKPCIFDNVGVEIRHKKVRK